MKREGTNQERRQKRYPEYKDSWKSIKKNIKILKIGKRHEQPFHSKTHSHVCIHSLTDKQENSNQDHNAIFLSTKSDIMLHIDQKV